MAKVSGNKTLEHLSILDTELSWKGIESTLGFPSDFLLDLDFLFFPLLVAVVAVVVVVVVMVAESFVDCTLVSLVTQSDLLIRVFC